MHKAIWYGLILFCLSILWMLLEGCAAHQPLKIKIPDCPSEHRLVEIIDGILKGESLDNLVLNHIDDHECIERLKKLLGSISSSPAKSASEVQYETIVNSP